VDGFGRPGKLFQTDLAVAGKVRSLMVECTARGATGADVGG